jgi:hypothetical protein
MYANNIISNNDIFYNNFSSLSKTIDQINIKYNEKQDITDNLTNIINNLTCPVLLLGPTNNPNWNKTSDVTNIVNYLDPSINQLVQRIYLKKLHGTRFQ